MRILGFDTNLKRSKPLADTSITEGSRRASSVYLMPWETSRNEVILPHDFNQLTNCFKSWVYICASKNATSIATCKLKLYVAKPSSNSKLLVKTKDITRQQEKYLSNISGLGRYINKAAKVEEILEHPFLDMLVHVNPLINRFDLFELTQLYLEMTGNSYWYVPKNGLNIPSQIWVIPSQNMRIVPDKNSMLKGYVYKLGTVDIPFDVSEIIHFKFSSITSQLYGMSPLAAVSSSFVFDQNIRNFENTLMKNNARPEAILESPNSINDKEFERLRAQWKEQYGGERNSGKTIILEKGLVYKPITMSAKDIQFMIGRKNAREEICAAFGVPLSKVTVEDVNKANAKMGEWQYSKDTIEPRLRRNEEKINEQLMPMYDDNIFVAYDTPIPEDEEFDLRKQESNLRTFVTTINEVREEEGKDTVEWGDVPIAPMGMAPLGSQQAPQYPGANTAPNNFEKPTLENGRPRETTPERGPVEPSDAVSPKELDEFVNKVVKMIKERI